MVWDFFCYGCQKPSLKTLCEGCVKKLPFSNHLILPRVDYIDRSSSLFVFERDVVSWVHQLKFQGRLSIAHFFSNYMVSELTLVESVDAVVAVPQHDSKTKERGFNPVFLIAKSIANQLRKPLMSQLIIKAKPTREQRGLTLKERTLNVKNTYRLNQKQQEVRHILLIDDVLTSGSTVKEVARILKEEALITKVTLWVVAKT